MRWVFPRALILVAIVTAGCRSEPAQDGPAPAPAPTLDPAPVKSADENDPFAPYPGSSELCNRMIFADGRPLRWRSWTSEDDWTKVIAHYRGRTKGMVARESPEKIEIAQTPTRVITIYPAALANKHPQCDKPLAPADKTVVMLSEVGVP